MLNEFGILNYLKKIDWLLMGAIILLMSIGLVTLFSLSSTHPAPFFKNQIFWIVLGILILIFVSQIDYRFFRTQSFFILFLYAAAVLGLALLFVVSGKIRGAISWFHLGKISLEPVEMTKIILVLLLAKYFSRRHIEIYRLRHLVISGLYILLPMALVLLQPDLGSAIILLALWTAIAVFSGISLRHFLFFLILLSLVSVLSWGAILHPYQKTRIITFFNPYKDPQGAGYNSIQAKIAVGSGQLWGKGVGYGSQSHLNFLPEAETDFIFAAFAEEWGLAGVVMLFGAFALLFWRIINIGLGAADNFSRLFSLGLAAIIFVQFIIHVGMNIGLMPITGISLPFVSYGGSSLLAFTVGMGILQNIKINSHKKIGPPTAEILK